MSSNMDSGEYRTMTPSSGVPLSELTDLVERVRATPKKTEKVALIADRLRQARGPEAALVAMYLTGSLPQGRIGVGWSAIESVMREASLPGGESLSLTDLDRAFDALSAERGAGSVQRRTQ